VSAFQLVIILVPVVFGLIGFAVDLGILYSIKGELKSGASAMALAAAVELIGTDTASASASSAAQATVETSSGFGNKYYFDGIPIGQTTGTLISTVSGPDYYPTLASALASATVPGGENAGPLARYVRVTLSGQTRLLFWSFLPIVSDRTVSVTATAVAGISAPLCEACAIEPITVAAVNQADTTDFGFVQGTIYSFRYLCTGPGTPPALPGAAVGVPYILLNRLDPNATIFADDDSQAFRAAAGGLPGNVSSAQACFRIANTELIWASATPNACIVAAVAPVVRATLCGLDARFETTPQAACSVVPTIDELSTIYQPDTDTNTYTVYSDYTGDGRRIVTIPIVDALSLGQMTVLAFRQFLVMPAQGAAVLNSADPFGRFAAMYIGSVAPIRQGRFDGCQQTSGPGKVVIHQ